MARITGQKIKYFNISRDYKSSDPEKVLNLLHMAQVITKVFRGSANIPFNASISVKRYKPFILDLGLLSHLAGIRKLQKERLLNIDPATKGVMAEQFACQHLIYLDGFSNRPEGFYWFREGVNRNAEVDFLIRHELYIIPVVVSGAPNPARSGGMGRLLTHDA